MTTLDFIANADGKQEAVFLSGDRTVLQINTKPSSKPTSIVLNARIGDDMPWSPIKTFVPAPAQLIVSVDVPSGVTIQVLTNADIDSAGVLIN